MTSSLLGSSVPPRRPEGAVNGEAGTGLGNSITYGFRTGSNPGHRCVVEILRYRPTRSGAGPLPVFTSFPRRSVACAASARIARRPRGLHTPRPPLMDGPCGRPPRFAPVSRASSGGLMESG